MAPSRATRLTFHWMAVLFVASGCSMVTNATAPVAGDDGHVIHVVRRERHTGIAVAVADWPNRAWPLLAEFPRARYLEFGWGDAVYYQAEKKTWQMTAAAVFWPTPTVMEVLGLRRMTTEKSAGYEAVPLRVSAAQLRALAESIEASFANDPPRATAAMAEIHQGWRRFYHARGSFHLFHMCNRWTADLLENAGCDLRPWPVLLASRVLREARRCEANR